MEACPPSGLYRLKKYVRRNRSLVATASLVMASLLIGLVVSVTGFVQDAEERNRAVGEGEKAVAAAELAEQERDRFRQERDRAIAAERLAEKRQQETEQKRREAEAVIDLLGEMIGSANPEQLKGPNRTVRQLLEEFSAKLDDRLIDQPAVEAKVQLMLSNVFHQYRLIDQGLLHASRAYEIRRELYGDDHELTVRALRDKGILMLVSGKDIGEGDQILEGIVRQHPPFMDQDHEFAIRTKNGALLIDQASPSERTNEFRELMEEAESKLGAEHYITCIVRSNYAGRLIGTQEYDEAERQIRLAITAKEAFSGEGDLRASLYRGMLGRIHYLRGDMKAAKEIGFAELALRRKQLGEAHGDTLSALRFALDCHYRLEEVRQAAELVEDYGTSFDTASLPDAIAAVRSITRVASANARATTAARDHLFDLATEVYLKAVRQEGAENLESGISEGQTLLRAVLQRNPESAEQIARSMWDVYGEHDTSLAGDLIRAMLAKDDLDGALHFVQQELSPQSAGFQELDTNSDGSITSLELPGFWNTQRSLFLSNGRNRVSNLDTNDDDKLTPEEVGETLWKVIADADHNQNGTIDAFEPAVAIDAAQFAKLDIDGDGKLTAEELTLQSVRLQRLRDHDGDGVVTREEYLKGIVRGGALGRGSLVDSPSRWRRKKSS